MGVITRLDRYAHRVISIPKAARLRLCSLPPNYIWRPTEPGIVIDAGCGHDAELSRHLIGLGWTAYGVDPTRKHAPMLAKLAAQSDGRFHHLAKAIGSVDGTMMFYESAENESGSLCPDHANVRRDTIRAYEVDVITLRSLAELAGSKVALLKLDLEGAEYNLLRGISPVDLRPFEQVFVEFHPHCTAYTPADMRAIINRLRSLGQHAFSRDGRNYLLWYS
jgi:FkbM family methyltransferase